MICIFCGNDINNSLQEWDEEVALKGFLEKWYDLPEGTHDPDCDKCWEMQQRIITYSDGEVLIRDNNWNWRQVAEKR